ncbi:hypothetical protein [Nocardioides sp.]|uniref:RCC1 domain-containing protein n=1 Tax=Nocardioides sp. TaxID=35761 RepID=UPI002732B207|nr:hypothetical protein [Nocardioides sp.]MDP3892378.1 hypothetical protein [Nocardioides sp.]
MNLPSPTLSQLTVPRLLAAATTLALASAAVSLPSYAAPNDAPARSDVARTDTDTTTDQRLAARKGLQVKVKRPAAAKNLVRVTVTGPNGFRKKIRRTTTWSNARPGRYRIKAKVITLDDQRVKPTVRPRKVRIRANRARQTSRVTYRLPAFCARSGSQAYAWGEGDHGRLGTTSSTDRLTPGAVNRLRGVTAITGGLRTSYALCGNGTVWAWGFNQNGELGNGATGDRAFPVRVAGLVGVTAIAARDQGALALRSDGTVWSWGWGGYGQLGNGAAYNFSTRQRTPVKVALPAKATAIAGGGNTAYALLANGTVRAWGNDGVGQLGNGAPNTDSATPVAVSGLTSVVELAAGHVTGYARTAAGGVRAWGGGNQGELGNNVTANSNIPVTVSLGPAASSIGASHSAGYAVTNAGSVYSWGSGRYGDLGYDNGGNPNASPDFNVTLTNVKKVVGAGYGGYALTTTGTVWAWGDNGSGQLGTGAAKTGPSHITGGVPTPAVIPGLSGVTAIGAGRLNGYAIR